MGNIKKIYRTKITIEVLSEEPIPSWMEAEDVIEEGNSGEFSITTHESEPELLTGYDAVKAVREQGSDPDFFSMDDQGNEIDF